MASFLLTDLVSHMFLRLLQLQKFYNARNGNTTVYGSVVNMGVHTVVNNLRNDKGVVSTPPSLLCVAAQTYRSAWAATFYQR